MTDKYKTGDKLNVDDLATVITKDQQAFNSLDIIETLEGFDTDDDGLIDFNEFSECMKKLRW